MLSPPSAQGFSFAASNLDSLCFPWLTSDRRVLSLTTTDVHRQVLFLKNRCRSMRVIGYKAGTRFFTLTATRVWSGAVVEEGSDIYGNVKVLPLEAWLPLEGLT